MLYRHRFTTLLSSTLLGGSCKPGWLEIKWCTSALVYADNILGGSVHTIKKNAEALEGASKETGPEVNADKTTYLIRMQD
jgi:hypothetical protein